MRPARGRTGLVCAVAAHIPLFFFFFFFSSGFVFVARVGMDVGFPRGVLCRCGRVCAPVCVAPRSAWRFCALCSEVAPFCGLRRWEYSGVFEFGGIMRTVIDALNQPLYLVYDTRSTQDIQFSRS